MNWRGKGQLISECLFDVLNFPKNKQKISVQESQKLSNHKIKALYNVFNTLNSPFLENLRHQKDILKLTDL